MNLVWICACELAMAAVGGGESARESEELQLRSVMHIHRPVSWGC
jgi:hypothetical protein